MTKLLAYPSQKLAYTIAVVNIVSKPDEYLKQILSHLGHLM